MSWLDVVERALDERAGAVPWFVRDDDAGWGDAELVRLLEVTQEHGVVVDVAVIPGVVGAATARTLADRCARGTVRVHQHGWRHVDHETEGRRCEFGPSRSADQQRHDVRAGRIRMAELFGPAVDPVFTPPWNRCTQDTVTAVRAEGLRVLSRDAGAAPVDASGLVEVPVSVDWFGRTRGRRWDRARLGTELAARVAAGGPVGLMLHHAVTDPDELADVTALLALLVRHPAAAATTLVALAEGARSSA